MKIHPSFIKNINWERSIKRPWYDLTALWRGRYETLHIELKQKATTDNLKDLE